MTTIARAHVVFGMALALLVGCGGPQVGTVSGTVTLDGRPVGGGTISFVSPSGNVVTASIQSDGTYVADNVLPGEVLVSVAPPPPQEDRQAKKQAKRAVSRPSGPWPERYGNPARSGLKCTVQPGANTYEAMLTKS